MSCGYVHCPVSEPFCYRRSCYKQCPPSTVTNASVCLDYFECNRAGWVTFNRTCIKECPPSDPVYDPLGYENECCVSCSVFHVVNNSVCINDLDCTNAGWQIYNKVCLQACPPSTREVNNFAINGDTCRSLMASYFVLGISVVLLIVTALGCTTLLINPGKRRKKTNQYEDEREPLICRADQTDLNGSGLYATESFVGRQPMECVDTSLKEIAIGDQPIHGEDTSVKEIDDWDETSVKKIPHLNRVNELVPIGYQDDHIEQFYRDVDQLSSIPTVVALKGFQSSDDSMGSSSYGGNN